MKKKLALTLGAVALILGIGAGGYCAYWSYHPDITLGRRPIATLEPGVELAWFSVSLGSRHGIPTARSVAEDVTEKLLEFRDWASSVERRIRNECKAPTRIVAYAEVKDGQTRFWGEGTVTTQDGETVPFFEEKVFDWVLVPDEALSQLKTSPF